MYYDTYIYAIDCKCIVAWMPCLYNVLLVGWSFILGMVWEGFQFVSLVVVVVAINET